MLASLAGDSHPRHLDDDGVAEGVAGRGRVSRPAEGWPRLRRLHPVSSAAIVPSRGRRYQPERLVQVFRRAGLRYVVLSAADSGKNSFNPRMHRPTIQKARQISLLVRLGRVRRQRNFGCQKAFRQPNGSRICEANFGYDHGKKPAIEIAKITPAHRRRPAPVQGAGDTRPGGQLFRFLSKIATASVHSSAAGASR